MALTKVSTAMFDTAAQSSDLNIDANTLFVDVSTNRVGIGTTSPSVPLEVSGQLKAGGITYPTSDGTNGQALVTNGSGVASFATVAPTAGTGVTVSGTTVSIGQAVATSSNVTFNNLVVAGTLTVNGATNTNSATNTTIEDILIELGTGTSGSPANDAGLVLERGSSDNVFIGWDESADTFTVGTGSFTGASSGNLTITPATAVFGGLTVDTSTLVVDASNNRVGIGNASPDVSLDIGSFTDAVHMPVGTTAQRPTGAAGYLRYNSTLNKFEGYTSSWGEIGGGGSNTFTTNVYTGDGSTTAFTLSQSVDSVNNLIVFIDGVYQVPTAAYTVSGTTLTMTAAPANTRKIVAYSVQSAISGTNLNQNSFTGNGSAVAFTLSIAPVNENNTQVFLDGVYQHKSTYATSGTTLTFDTAPASGVAIEVMVFTQTEINVPVDGTITTVKLAADAVTSAKIADDAVGNDQLASGLTLGGNTTATIATAAQPNITSLGTLTALTIDDITIDGSTISDAGDLTLDIAGDIILDADGGDIKFKDGGTHIGTLGNSSNDLFLYSLVSNAHFKIFGTDAGSQITALDLDMENAGRATFNNTIIATGATLTNSSSGATATGNTVLTVESNDNTELSILGGSSSVLALNFGHSGDNNEGMLYFDTTAGSEVMQLESSKHITFRAGAANVANNITFKSYNTSIMTIDGSNNRVGIGIDSSMDRDLHIKGSGSDVGIQIEKTGVDELRVAIDSTGPYLYAEGTAPLRFYQNTTEVLRINSGNIGIGDAPSSFTNAALHVAKDMGSSVTAVARLRGRNTTARTTRLQFEDYSGAIADGLIDFHFPNAGSHTGAYFGMGYNAGNQLAINSSGYVGIGTTTPKRMLQVGNNTQAIAALSLQTTTSGLSRIYMGSNDGTAAEYTGMISYVHSDDQLQLFTSQSNRMVIDSSGRVLIGHNLTSHANGYSTPGGNSGESAHYSKLWIQGNTYSNAGDGRITLASGTAWPSAGTQIGAVYFSTAWGGDHAALSCEAGATGNTDYPGNLFLSTTADGSTTMYSRLRLDHNGRFNVTDNDGTMPTFDRHGFEVKNGSAWTMSLRHRGTGGDPHGLYINYSASSPDGTGSWFHYCVDGGGTLRFGVKSDGDIVTHDANINSDRNLKTNIVDATPKLADIMKLKVRNFEWKKEYHPGKEGKKMIGLIAQEVEEVFPALVTEMDIKDKGTAGENPDHVPEMRKTITATALNAILIKAVQELTARVEELEAK